MAAVPASPVKVIVPMPICGIWAPWASTYCIGVSLGVSKGNAGRPPVVRYRENARLRQPCQPVLLRAGWFGFGPDLGQAGGQIRARLRAAWGSLGAIWGRFGRSTPSGTEKPQRIRASARRRISLCFKLLRSALTLE